MNYRNYNASPHVEMDGSAIHCPVHGKVWSKRFMMPKKGNERTPPDSYAVAQYICERCFQQKTHCEDCSIVLEENEIGYTRCKACFDKEY